MKVSNPVSVVAPTAPKDNLKSFFRCFQNSSEKESWQGDGLFFWHTDVAHPWFNGVLVDRAPDQNEYALVKEFDDFFIARKVRSYTVWLQDEARYEAWRDYLLPHGFVADSNTPGMTIDLAVVPESVPTPDGFTIQVVDSMDDLRTWTKTFVRGYGLPDSFTGPIYKLFASIGTGLPLRHYLGIFREQPMSASSLFLEDGTAGIYNVATLPEGRGQGLGSAVTLRPLLEAREMGCKVAALQSSDLGFRVYERLGFRRVCMMDHFYRALG